MAIPMWLAKTIAWVGILLMAFAIIDLIASDVFSTQITGAKWSPVAELAGGFVMKHFGEALEEE